MKLLCDENLWGGREMLAGLGETRFRAGRDVTRADIAWADVLLLRSQTQIDSDLLGNARPRFVATATAGTEHVNEALLARRGIPFASAPGSNAAPVADWVMSVLAIAMLERDFDPQGARCAVLGCGEVGSRVAHRLTALGADVLAYDPPRQAMGLPLPGRAVPLDEAIAADLVTLHAPLTAKTRHLLGHSEIAALRPGAILLNSARGSVIDDAALRARLERRKDLFVALDVYEHEPVPDDGLLCRCRIATPHIAGHSIDGKYRGTAMVRDALCRTLGLDVPDAGLELLPPAPATVVIGETLRDALVYAASARSLERDARAWQAPAKDPAIRRARFDAMRRSYAAHRDFSELRVVATGSAARFLQGCGFRVEVPA